MLHFNAPLCQLPRQRQKVDHPRNFPRKLMIRVKKDYRETEGWSRG